MLPWSAPGYGQGIFPSQASFPGQTIDPRLVESLLRDRAYKQQQLSQSIQGAVAGLGQLIDQHRQDAIASQLLAGSAPKAQAVGGQQSAAATAAAAPDAAYAERGLELSPTGQPIAPATPPASLATFRPVATPPAGVPSTALSPAEIAQNARLGFPSQQLMRPSEIYTAREHLYDQSLSDTYKRAQIAHLMNTGAGGSGSGVPRYEYTEPTTGRKILVTGNEFANLQHTQTNPWAKWATVGRGKIVTAADVAANEANQTAFKQADVGKFTNQYSGAGEGEWIKLRSPTGKEATIPYESYQQQIGGGGKAVAGGGGAGTAGEPADGTPGTVNGQPAVWRSGIGWVAR